MERHHPPVILTGLSLHYLLWPRTLAISGLVLAIGITYIALGIPFPFLPVASVIIILGAFTLFSWYGIAKGRRISERFLSLQLLADIVALTVLLYFTGGSANPFVSLLLLPVTVAAAVLSTSLRVLIALAAALCYTTLMFAHVPDPHWGHADKGFALHVWGMWFGFLLSAGLVVYFVARMGSALREHDRALATARQEALQTEQLVALGTLATGTAHELGTPLATMAVLSNEIRREHEDDSELTEKLAILRGQIDRCKEILSRMAARAGEAQAEQGRRLPVSEYLEDLITDWRGQRPQIKVSVHWAGSRPGPQIVADTTLSQAIVNIFDNAADASADSVEIDARWDTDELRIEVHDHGAGLPETIRQQLGRPFVTTKPQGKGLGLGLYLARTTLNRLGGTVQLNDRGGNGVTAEITLPFSALTTEGG